MQSVTLSSWAVKRMVIENKVKLGMKEEMVKEVTARG